MDRIILGKAPPNETGSIYYHRAGNTGFFVSKPSQNVMSAADGNLLIDTNDGFFQILKSGEARIPVASGTGIGQEGTLAIQTTVNSPHNDEAPVMIGWNIIVESANANPALGGTLYGGREGDSIVAISNFSSIGTQFIEDVNQWELSGYTLTAGNSPELNSAVTKRQEIELNLSKQNRVIPQIGLVCVANTLNKQIILEFKNGSTVNTQLVYWKLYRERGVT